MTISHHHKCMVEGCILEAERSLKDCDNDHRPFYICHEHFEYLNRSYPDGEEPEYIMRKNLHPELHTEAAHTDTRERIQ